MSDYRADGSLKSSHTQSLVDEKNKDIYIAHIVHILEKLYPLKYREEWDHPGLITGDPTHKVHRILCAVDPTIEVVEEACQWNADLLITHHPLFFRATHEVNSLNFRGYILQLLQQSSCALWCGHTNADSAHRGVNEALASLLGLRDCKPLSPAAEDKTSQLGIGRIGYLDNPLSLDQFAQRVSRVLPFTYSGIDICGDLDQIIRKVAICGGSGDTLIDEAQKEGADVYLTSDLRHHPVTDMRQQAYINQLWKRKLAALEGTCCFAVGESSIEALSQLNGSHPMAFINTPHYSSEKVWFNYAVEDIQKAIGEITNQKIEIRVSQIITDPWVKHMDFIQEKSEDK